MRILLNISGSPDLSSDEGGAIERVVSGLAGYLARSADVTVFGDLSPLDSRVRAVKFKKKMVLNLRRTPGNLIYMLTALSVILKLDCDVIVAAHPRNYFLSLAYALIKRKPLVSWEMDHDPWVGEPTFVMRIYRRLVRRADRIITISEEQARRLESNGLDPARVTTIAIPVDTAKYRPATPQGNRPYLLYVAKWLPRKRQHLLIEAFASLAGRFEDLDLVLVGPRGGAYNPTRQSDGSDYFFECLQLVGASELEQRIRTAERLSEDDLISCYQGCSIFVFPSVEEAFGLTLLEAMASGCPCICNDIEPMRTVLGDAGVLLDMRGHDDLAPAIEELLLNPGKRADMGARARRRAVSSFAPENIYGRFRLELEGLLSETTRNRRRVGA